LVAQTETGAAAGLDQKRLDQIIRKTGEKIADLAEWISYDRPMLVQRSS
jgi:hypothetical protein